MREYTGDHLVAPQGEAFEKTWKELQGAPKYRPVDDTVDPAVSPNPIYAALLDAYEAEQKRHGADCPCFKCWFDEP